MKQQYTEVVGDCLETESAYCTAACPFHLDTRDFMAKMRRGAFSAAFKAFRDAVGLPRIVSVLCDQRCRAVCPRAQTDEALQMALLEKAAIEFAGTTAPNRYVMPRKKKSIAIVGAGPSGLACALRLASRQYDVTIFEKTKEKGGHLRDILAPELLLRDINEQFTYESVEERMGAEIRTLDELAGFDAVYIATGAGGTCFGLARDPGGAFASGKPGCFLGGSLTGSDSITSIADGLHAVHAIERYLKIGEMNHPQDRSGTRMMLDPRALTVMPPVKPASGSGYTEEEAASEAARCLRCACDACIRRCDLMTYYKKFPRRICDEVAITIDPASLDGEETFAKRLMATCNQCGACADGCPEHIDMGAFLLDSRRAMHKKGKLPWAFYDFWLKDMQHAQGPASALARIPGDGDTAAYAFFPGCQLGASDPSYVLESYRYLLSALPGTALWLSCCSAPAVWSGDEELSGAGFRVLREQWEKLGKPMLLFACPTCKQMFESYLPDADGIFLYDLLYEQMLKKAFVPRRDMRGAAYAVFDPCTSRMETALHASVRALAHNAGAALTPLPDEGRDARCCSWGGHVSIANPGFAKTVIDKRIGQSELPYITYCANCRDIFAAAGKKSLHLLDVLFDLNPDSRQPPGCNERRENRAVLRRQALSEFWGEEAVEMRGTEMGEEPHENMILHMDEALRQKLEDELSLVEDIRRTIIRCETSGRTIKDEVTGNLHGYAVVGRVTCWAEYQKLAENEYLLLNAYTHRMSIDLEETWQGQKVEKS